MPFDENKNYDALGSLVVLTMDNNAVLNTLLEQVVKLRIENLGEEYRESVIKDLEETLSKYKDRASELLIESSRG